MLIFLLLLTTSVLVASVCSAVLLGDDYDWWTATLILLIGWYVVFDTWKTLEERWERGLVRCRCDVPLRKSDIETHPLGDMTVQCRECYTVYDIWEKQ